MMTELTRREFLKLGGMALAGAPFIPLPPRDQRGRDRGHLGRVAEWTVYVRTEPNHQAPVVRRLRRDDVITYFDEVETEGYNPYNPIWFRLIDGYAYSSGIQPVEIHYNVPQQHIPKRGLWGEISLPYTYARTRPSPDAYHSYRLPYSSVYRISEAVWGTDHQLWYRMHESQSPGAQRYVPATHVRPLLPEDLAPISPHAPNKRIVIKLSNQSLTAFEGRRQVFRTHISGGTGGNRSTPQGHHHIIFKSPSRHMVGEDFDLPGVPFASFFWGAVAIHGAYWHNDFGVPRSHGCVNVSSEASRWIFRWTHPVSPYEEDVVRVEDGGTPVIVIY